MVLMIGAHMARRSCLALQVSARDDLDHWNPVADFYSRNGIHRGSYSGGFDGRMVSRGRGPEQRAHFRFYRGLGGTLHPWCNTSAARHLVGFFAIHVFRSAWNYVCLYRVHLWLVLRHGISSRRLQATCRSCNYRAEYEELLRRVASHFWPDLAWRDVIVATF